MVFSFPLAVANPERAGIFGGLRLSGIFEHDARKHRLWLADGVAVGQKAPVQVGEFEAR